MPDNGETFHANDEKVGETTRGTFEERGEKTLSAEDEARLEELYRLKEEQEKILHEYEEEEKRLESEREELLKRLKDKQKSSKGFKKLALSVAIIAGAAGIVALAALNAGKKQQNDELRAMENQPRVESEYTAPEDTDEKTFPYEMTDDGIIVVDSGEKNEAEKEWKELTGIEFLDQKIDGSFLQYDNLGCYSDNPEEKANRNAIGNPDAVLRAMGIDPSTATAEQRGKVDEYLTYSMEEKAAFKAIAFGINGFEGLTLREAEDKIHGMSAEEKSVFQDKLKENFDKTSYVEEEGNGVYRNHYIYQDGDEKHGNFQEDDLTGKKLLVAKTLVANGDKVRVISKEDCANDEDMVVIEHPDNSTTPIIIVPDVVPDKPTPDEPTPDEPTPDEPTPDEPTPDEPTPDEPTPDEPTPDEPTPDEPTPDEPTPDEPTPDEPTPDEPTPEVTPAPKNEEAEKQNAGPRVDERELDETETPATTLEQDQENFEDILRQQLEEEAARRQAEETARAQAEAEAQAAKEAEARRQAEAQAEQDRMAALEEQARAEAEAQAAEEKRLADEAAAAAAAQAAELQAQAEEAERQRIADMEAAAAAQAAADAQAPAQAAESESNDGLSAGERASMFDSMDW